MDLGPIAIRKGLADDALAVSPMVDVGRVQVVDAAIDGLANHLHRQSFLHIGFRLPARQTHRAETERRDLFACLSQAAIFHRP